MYMWLYVALHVHVIAHVAIYLKMVQYVPRLPGSHMHLAFSCQ